MVINKTSSYNKCISKLKKQHKNKELENIFKLEEVLSNHKSLHVLMISSMWKIYRFEKLVGDKKGSFSARISKQYRLEFKPINETGYEIIDVVELDLKQISNHYKKI